MGILAILSIILTVLRSIPELLKLIRMIIELLKGSDPDLRERLGSKIKEAYSSYLQTNDKEKLAMDMKDIATHCEGGICNLK